MKHYDKEMKLLIENGLMTERGKKLLETTKSQGILFAFSEGIKQNVDFYKKSGVMDIVRKYTKAFLDIDNDALNVNENETLDAINATMTGTHENEALEMSSSFFDYIKNAFSFLSKKEPDPNNIQEKLSLNNYGKDMANLFAEGYEINLKLITFVIGIINISKNKDANLEKVSKIAGKGKLDKLESLLKNSEHKDIIMSNWPRKIRNSASHVDMTFDTLENRFYCKLSWRENGQDKTQCINMQKDDVYALIVRNFMFVQGYIFAFNLIDAELNDEKIYNELIDYIFN